MRVAIVGIACTLHAFVEVPVELLDGPATESDAEEVERLVLQRYREGRLVFKPDFSTIEERRYAWCDDPRLQEELEKRDIGLALDRADARARRKLTASARS